MTYSIKSDSPYVLPEDQRTEGGAPGQQIYVDPTPQVTFSGGNVRLTTS